MHKLLLTALLGAGLGFVPARAQVIIRVRPPHAVREHRPRAPSRGHVWIPGYQRWDGRGYQWVPGRWDLPPRPRAVWVAPRWVHRGGGWVFVEGRWR